ncbi:MAG: class I SAM-dependent methyltransferase [Anaerolineae bacterium]
MSIDDARRWNARYRRRERESFHRPRAWLVQHAHYLPARGLALDTAMGLGGNAGFLLERGLRVVGVDIAAEALQRAKARLPALMAVLADLTRISLPPATFDVILNFYYLQRELWPQYRRALRPGGLLLLETLRHDPRFPRPDVDPAYLLKPGELQRAFVDWEVLAYREDWSGGKQGHLRPTASLVARLPTMPTPE